MKRIKVAVIGDSNSPNLQSRVKKLSSYKELEVQVFDNAYIRYEEDRIGSKFLKFLKLIPKAATSSWLLWRYMKLRQFSPDITFVMYADPYSLLITQFLKTGKIISTWGSDILKEQGALSRLFDRFIVKWAMKKANQIYCVSNHLKEEVLNLSGGNLREEPIVLHYGIDLKLYNWDKFRFENADEVYGEKIFVIFSPRWCLPVYNIEGIIDAFIILHERINNVILKYREIDLENTDNAVKCHAPIEEKIRRAGKNGHVEKLGLQSPEECLNEYHSSQIVISLAHSDGTPLSVLEAMAAGCIVVCNRLPSLEKIIKNGENGFLVDGNNPNEVADTLQFIIQNYKEIHQEIGMAARAYVEKNANMQLEIDHYVQRIKSIHNKN